MGVVAALCEGDFIQIECAVLAVLEDAMLHAGHNRGRCRLVHEDVILPTQVDLVALFRVHHQGDQVAHAAAGHEKPGLLASDLRTHFLQPIHGGVLVEDIVAHLGRGNDFAHGFIGLGHGVTSEIYETHGAPFKG